MYMKYWFLTLHDTFQNKKSHPPFLCFHSSSPPLLYIGSQGSSSDTHSRGPVVRELAGSSDGTNSRGGFSHQPLVPHGLPVAPDSYRSPNRSRPAVAPAHRENPLAQEAGTGLWGSPELAWWGFLHLLHIVSCFVTKFSRKVTASSLSSW